MNPSFLIFAVSLPILLLIGYSVSALILPASLTRKLAWALAPGIGAGVCSLIFFVFRRPVFTVEIALLLLLSGLLYRRGRVSDLLPGKWHPTGLGLVLCVVTGAVFGTFLWRVDKMPRGDWDGWAIWNTHARVLYRDGPNWKNIQYTHHGDYPLLAPSITARFWRYAGQDVPEAGAIVGTMLALASVALLAAVLSEVRSGSLAALFALILISTPNYLDLATSQYADVPLSFFIVATIALICIQGQRGTDGRGAMVLAGFSAGCAGWTKNEGLLFSAAVCFALVLPVLMKRTKPRQQLLPFLAGLLLPLLVTIAFKVAMPAHNDLIAEQNYNAMIQKITSLDRYELTFGAFLRTSVSFGTWSISPLLPLLAFTALWGTDRAMLRNSNWRAGCFILAFMLVGYFFVYILTPIELQAHLNSSLHRLMIQLWPAFLLLLGLCTATKTDIPQVVPAS